ncbi:hypothetical protein ACFC00_18645 [Streptomyces adustus]|uniref:hypothetical protein n=1 Tax=Streptomyces adustus TaxID=1609272 RepID=UPI0035E2207C
MVEQGTGQEAEPVLGPLGCSPGQEKVHLTLLALGGEHIERLAGALDLPLPVVAEGLAGLEALGLVTRQDAAESGRYAAMAPDVAVRRR